jgi:sugar O-acyltransferase (sialic acid O-acetyltransferase NeuD family)
MKLILYGASGHGKVILDIIIQLGIYNIAGFIDDNENLVGSKFCGYEVLCTGEMLSQLLSRGIEYSVVSIGNNFIRGKKAELLVSKGFKLVSAIHPKSVVNSNVDIGVGTVIMAGAVINSGTVIGKNVIINTSATVDHDCIIGDCVHISPGANLAGGVKVGELTHIGIGSCVIENITIGKNSIIGAGAVVSKDIPDNVVAVGVPAKVIKERETH